MLTEILSIIAPVFICAAVGFGWVRSGHAFETAFVSKMVINVGAPCLIFSTFLNIQISQEAFTTMMVATLAAMVVFGITGYLVLKACGLSQQAFLPSQIFPNVGNMGLPLCLLAFGDEGLALGLTYFMVNSLFGFTFGLAISSGKMSFGELLRNPIFYAVAITLSVFFTGFRPPLWIQNTTQLLGGLTIPLMLIALGVSLGSVNISGLKRSFGLSALRLGLGFGTGVGLSAILGMEGTAKGILILQSTMPVAVFSYLFAVRYNRQPADVAGTVVISTEMSFLTLPLLLWFVLP
jgi:predicted permease